MANARADEERKTKRRKLLLSEFQAGVWTREEYRTEVRKLDEPNTLAAAPSVPRSASPEWIMGKDGELPEDDDNLYA
jgi:hypothetical protein